MTTITKINDNLSLIQNENGLTFGTDAYLLSAYTVGRKNKIGADLGSGTGVIPLLLCSRENVSRYAPAGNTSQPDRKLSNSFCLSRFDSSGVQITAVHKNP